MLPSLWGRQSWITEMLNASIEIDQNNINDALPAEILQTIFRLVDLTFIKKNGEKAKIMCGVAMNDFPHRFLSPADLKVVVTVCRSIFKFDLTLLKIWKKLTHRLWRDVGSHSLLWSSVKLCCHKRNLEEMPQILSSTRCHIIILFYLKTHLLTITTYKQLQSGLRWSEKSQL